MRTFFKNIYTNYAGGILIFGMLYAVFMIGLYLAGIENDTIRNIVAFASAAILAFGDRATVALQTRAKLTMIGQETDTWLDPGTYFLFWIFGIYTQEIQEMQKRNVVVTGFDHSDRNGKKLHFDIDIDWAIGKTPEQEERFKVMKEEDMNENLTSLTRKTAKRVLGALDYWTDMVDPKPGRELHILIENDDQFRSVCDHYGVEITSIIVEVTSGDLDADNRNSIRRKATEEARELYPKATDKEIARIVAVQMGGSKVSEIFSDAPVTNRHNVE